MASIAKIALVLDNFSGVSSSLVFGPAQIYGMAMIRPALKRSCIFAAGSSPLSAISN